MHLVLDIVSILFQIAISIPYQVLQQVKLAAQIQQTADNLFRQLRIMNLLPLESQNPRKARLKAVN